MSRPARFTEADLDRALRAAAAIGPDAYVESKPDGTLLVGQENYAPILIKKEQPRTGPVAQGHIYFVRAGTRGPIKIGFSIEPKKRIASLQTSTSKQLVLLGVTPGTMQEEGDLHAKFGHLRERGEWFRPAQELLSYIKGVAL